MFKPLLPLHRQLLSVFIDLGLVCRLLLFSRQIPDSLFISTFRSINKICWFLKPRPRSLRRFFELINHIKLLLQFFLLLNSFFSLFKKKHALFIDLWRLLLGSLFFFAKLSFSEFFFCCFELQKPVLVGYESVDVSDFFLLIVVFVFVLQLLRPSLRQKLRSETAFS